MLPYQRCLIAADSTVISSHRVSADNKKSPINYFHIKIIIKTSLKIGSIKYKNIF